MIVYTWDVEMELPLPLDAGMLVELCVAALAEADWPALPPQPMPTTPSASTSTSTTQNALFFFVLPPTTNDPAAMAKKGRVNAKSGFVLGTGVNRETVTGMLIVKLTLVIPPEGVTVLGENEQVAPTGNPEQLRVTTLLNPFSGVITICELPAPAELRITPWAGALSMKSGDPLPTPEL